jgi:hypothetical protein
MVGHPKALFDCDPIPQLDQVRTGELKQLPATSAVQMIVLRITVVMLEDASTIKLKGTKEPRFFQLDECAIDCRAAHIPRLSLSRHLVNQLIRIEMFVTTEDLFQNQATLFGISLPLGLEILFKTSLWRRGDLDSTEIGLTG